MVDRSKKDYFCTLVSEDVEIALKSKFFFNGGNSKVVQLVQCNQLECQYVDLNQLPCPLTLDLFATELERRKGNRRDRSMEY